MFLEFSDLSPKIISTNLAMRSDKIPKWHAWPMALLDGGGGKGRGECFKCWPGPCCFLPPLVDPSPMIYAFFAHKDFLKKVSFL